MDFKTTSRKEDIDLVIGSGYDLNEPIVEVYVCRMWVSKKNQLDLSKREMRELRNPYLCSDALN